MKKTLLIFAAVSAFCLGIFSPGYVADNLDQQIKLYLGEAKVITAQGLTRIAVGNPDIADVANVAKDEFSLTPKAVGMTTLVYWDASGEHSFGLKVISEKIDYLKKRVDVLLLNLNLPDIKTVAEEDEGKILLLGRIKTAQDKEKINLILGSLRDRTVDLLEVKEEEAIIEIDVQVLELDKDATKTLGFTNPLSSTITFTEVGSLALTGTNLSNIWKVFQLQRGAFAWTLDALVQEGKARILSRPRLACQSGKEAELLVGGEKPIFSTTVASAGGQGTSVDYKEFGIKLKIKPTITEQERIKLALNMEVSEVGTAETIGSSTTTTAKAYPLSKRTASTELFLNNEETMAVGGLMKQKMEETVTKTPWLGDIPVFGLFFRKRITRTGGGFGEKGDTELYIVLTPRIISKKDKSDEPKQETVKSPVKDTAVKAQPPQAQEAKKIETKPLVIPSKPSVEIGSGKPVPDYAASYTRAIQSKILDTINYPLDARQAGFQGMVKVGLHFSSDGQLQEAVIRQSSGYKMLDEDALSTVKKISTFPPFPASIEKDDLWIEIPIDYRLS